MLFASQTIPPRWSSLLEKYSSYHKVQRTNLFIIYLLIYLDTTAFTKICAKQIIHLIVKVLIKQLSRRVYIVFCLYNIQILYLNPKTKNRKIQFTLETRNHLFCLCQRTKYWIQCKCAQQVTNFKCNEI